jgi:hypothetical protein
VGRIRRFAGQDAAAYPDDVLVAQPFGGSVRLRCGRRIEDHLDETRPIAQFHEDELSQITAPVDPPGEHDLALLVGVVFRELTATEGPNE